MVPALSCPCTQTGPLQQLLLQPHGHRQLFPAHLSIHKEGAPGVAHKQYFPSIHTPHLSTLALHPMSCLVDWLGRLLNELLFMGFSSARLTNPLIPNHLLQSWLLALPFWLWTQCSSRWQVNCFSAVKTKRYH